MNQGHGPFHNKSTRELVVEEHSIPKSLDDSDSYSRLLQVNSAQTLVLRTQQGVGFFKSTQHRNLVLSA